MASSYMSSSSYTMAKRNDGVCQGSLWRSLDDNNSNTSPTTSTYSVLVGIKLICYESLVCMEAGHHPIASYAVVGASAMSTTTHITSSSSSSSSSTRTTFRIVSNQGTHLICSAPTSSCRDVWLSALNAGLEYRLQPTLTGLAESSKRMSRPRPKVRGGVLQKAQRFCHACGKLERLEFPLSQNQAPLPQYGIEERVDLCRKCDLAQGVVDHCSWVEELYATREQELHAMLTARQLILAKLTVGKVHAKTTDDKEGGAVSNSSRTDTAETESGPTDADGVPTQDNPNSGEGTGGESDTSETKPTLTETKVESTPSSTGNEQVEDDSEYSEYSECSEEDDKAVAVNGYADDGGPDRDASGRLLPKSHTLQIKPLSHHLVGQVLNSAGCMACQRLSPTFAGLCVQFQQGMVGVIEFVELLEHAIGIRDPAMAELKKQAFRVAGDMGTALKLLYEQCLPPVVSNVTSSGFDGRSSHHGKHNDPNANANSTELLQCILEFFLDLVDEGELNTLAFFWPQLSNIHLQMLPPRDTTSLQKVELLEDFLLTVASRYSVHLAIQLVWSHVADLEDAMSGSHYTAPCAHRKSAVLRFLCELESLLFDFDTGWGGGSVTVGQFLAPSNHQIDLLKAAMGRIQEYRLAAGHDRLSRSHRLFKLQAAVDEAGGNGISRYVATSPPEVLAREALRIAKNADYLSCHLAFTRRLCDMAERLRFLPIGERPEMLQVELSKLNASGAMGGDLLNKVKKDELGHTRVVRIPVTEGHVFRSKERTPVLLLVETLDEGAENGVDLEKKFIKENIRASIQYDDSIEPSTTTANAPATIESQGEGTVQNGDKNNGGFSEPTDDGENKEVVTETESQQVVDDDGEAVAISDAATATPVKENGAELCHDVNGKESTANDGDVNASGDEAHSKKEAETDVDDNSVCQVAAVSSELKKVTIAENPTSEAPSATEVDTKGTGTTHSRHSSMQSEASAPLPGSSQSFNENPEETRHALRRFDSPKTEPKIMTPTASKAVIEALLTNVVAKQLALPTLATPEVSDGDDDVESKQMEHMEVSSEAQQQLGVSSPSLPKPSKISTLGSSGCGQKEEHNNPFSKTGGTRRDVLNTIMSKGMSGSHVIAEQAATGAQRHLQDLERRVAVEALLTGHEVPHGTSASPDKDERRSELLSLGIRSASQDDLDSNSFSEEDEAMEAIRLLLIQYRVATGSISANDVAVALSPNPQRSAKKHGKGTIMHFGREFPEIDAGDIDSRLVGCGFLPPAVLQALTLWKGEMISNGELLELVKKDLEFEKNSKGMEKNTDKLNEDSAFWGRFAFGERWAEKRSRLAAKSPDASKSGWDLIGVIVKSNDDLRQESFIMQLIELCQEAFQEAELELWLLPYRIVSTSRTTGIIEMVRNAMSFDALKKRPGYGAGGLREHLQRMTRYAADPGEAFKSAQRNFVRSLAAYSLLSYLFLFKDRHNGNILLDTAGHVIHIDFGFVFGIAPGGNFSLEMSTPFKLTDEMIEVMDGLRSSLFSEFVTLFCCGFLALQGHCGTFMTLVEVTSRGSTFKCFEGRDTAEILGKMHDRFRPDLGKEETVAHVLDIIKESIGSYGTKQYDYFQYLSQGIAT